MMEHRWNPRIPLVADALLRHPRQGLLPTRITNISRGGAFLHISPTGLQPYTRVRLICRCREKNTAQLRFVSALVVRVTPAGAGIMFDEINAAEFNVLLTYLVKIQSESSRYIPHNTNNLQHM